MEIKGDEFLKNVQIKQEEETLKQKLSEFENFRQQNSIQDNPYNEYVNNEPYDDNELGDILLQHSTKTNSKENKNKYIILGIALILLFVITIIIVRLITNDANDVRFQEQSSLEQDKALNDEKIQQEYQQILTDKLKKVNKDTSLEIPEESNNEIQNLEEQEEIILKKEEVRKPNPLNITKKEPTPIKKKVVNTVKKTTPVKIVAKQPTNTKKIPTATKKGIYIQLGAFSKTPSNKYLSSISSKGYKFKLHRVTIQGKELIKVLVGPYTNRTQAQNNLTAIRTTFNVAGAYILEI